MHIRHIQEADIKACATLYSEVFSSAPWNEAWTGYLAFQRLMHFYQSKGFVGVLAVSDKDDEVVGLALGNCEPFYSGPIFYLREMCIKPNFQNKGTGSTLIQSLEAELKKQGIKSLYLATERDIPASHFYVKNGFSISDNTGVFEKDINA